MYYHPACNPNIDQGVLLTRPPAPVPHALDEAPAPFDAACQGGERILLAVDGSDASLRAAALSLRDGCGRPDLRIHLLNVQMPIMSSDVSTTMTMDAIAHDRLQAGLHVVDSVRDMLESSGLVCVTSVSFGKPAETIARYALEHGIDRIVMGTRGMNPLRSVVMGSVASKVVHLVDVPVTLVK